MRDTNTYWEKCGKVRYIYKGEEFYTISPIPYFLARRKIIWQTLIQIIKKSNCCNLCDFGCGDGVSIKYLKEKFPSMKIHGVDAAHSMIEKAKNINKISGGGQIGSSSISFEETENGIQCDKTFDLIYSVAVFAHIEDYAVENLFLNIYKHLNGGGQFVIFEQIGKKRTFGETYIRRTQEEYENLLNKAGFKIIEKKVVDFWFYRLFFERKIAKVFYRAADGETEHDKRVSANSNLAFRTLSKICIELSHPYIFKDDRKRWGYGLYIVRKEQNE